MPSLDAHLAAVESNLAAYDAMPEAIPDWRAVTLFYTGVHLVEAYGAVLDVHNNTHAQREPFVRTQLRDVWKQYLRLRNESLKARYLALPVQGGTPLLRATEFSLSAAQVHEQLRKKCIRALHGSVNEKLMLAGVQVVEVT